MKKSLLKNVKLVLASALLMFTSCEIGLGSAVDTEPPSVSISQPSADSIVRKNFVLSGNWSDDLSIDSVTVELRDVNDKSIKYGLYSATIKGEGTSGSWTCALNPEELHIPDGTYVATITAKDDAEHSSLATTTFSIDNTPPLIVLESPNTTSITNPNAYGQVFSVGGKAADDSDVDSIDFIFYDQDGNEIHRVNKTGVGTQLEVTVAQWGDEVYNKIYGNNKEAGTKAYYVGLVAYDGARKVPAEEGDKGNPSQYFYLWDELESAIGEIKTSVGYKVMNGRSATSADTKELWESALDSCKLSKATFSLNPVNNPYFEVSRFEGFSSGKVNLDAQNYEFTNKNTLVVNLYRGRDNKAIKVNTIGVYLRECDVNGNLKEGAAPITLLQPYCDEKGEVYKDASGNPLINQEEHNSKVSNLGSSYSLTFSVNNEDYPSLEFNKYYVLDVVAFDNNKIGMYNENYYGFKFVTTATPPVVTISNPENGNNIPKSNSFTVKGFAKTSEDKIVVKAYNLANSLAEITGTPFATSEGTNPKISVSAYSKAKNGFDFEFTVDTTSATVSGDDLPVIAVEATSGSGQVSSTTIKIDPVLPTIGDYSVSPTVEEERSGVKKEYVNGTVTIKQALSDNQMIKSAQYSLDGGTTWLPETPVATNMLSFDVDTTKFPDEVEKIVKIRATDTAGNVSEGTISLNISQKTDAPSVKLSNVDTAQSDIPAIIAAEASSKNIFNSMNNKLLGTITDDDGIATIKIMYNKLNYNSADNTYSESEWKTITANGNGKTSYNLIHELKDANGNSLEQGDYLFKFEVVDNKQDSTGYASKTTDVFAVALDEGAPNFIVTTTSGSLQAENTALPVAGNWSDGTNIVINRCKLVDGAYVVEKSSSESGSPVKVNANGTWADTIPGDVVGTDGGTRYYIATDKYGQKTTQTFVFKVDSLPPTFTITNVNGTATTLGKDSGDYSAFAKTSGIFTVKGTLAEPDPDSADPYNEGSGLDDFIYYYITEDSNDIEISSGSYVIDGNNKIWKKEGITKTTKIDGNSENAEWTANIDISSGYAEGTNYTLYIAAKDKARNISKIAENPSAKIILKPDSTAPIFNDADDSLTGVQELKVSNTKVVSTTTEDITIVADITDATSGVKEVKLYRSGVDTGLTAVIAGTKYTFTIPSSVGASDSKLQAGANEFTVKATDQVGNSKESTVTINVDKQNPTVSINTVSPNYTQTDAAGVSTYVVKGEITISVRASDETNLKELRWFYGTVPADKAAVTGQSRTISGLNKDEKITVNADSLTYSGNKVTFTVYAFDKSDNVSDAVTCVLGKDTVAPVIENVKVKGTALVPATVYYYSKNSSLTITGTAKEGGTDASLQSGLSKVEYGVAKGDVTSWPAEATGITKDWQLTSGTASSWTAKIDSDSISAEGEYTIFFKATDEAGNEAVYASPVKVVADAAAPEIKITKINGTEGVSGDEPVFNSYYTASVVIEGELTETYPRGFTVTATKDGGASYSITPSPAPATTGTQSSAQAWTITVPDDGKYEITITAKDELNEVTHSVVKFAIDTKEPTFGITNVKNDAITLAKDSAGIEKYGNTTDYFTVKGTVADAAKAGATYASGVASSIYYIAKKTSEALTDTGSYSITSSWSSAPVKADGTWEAPVSFASFADGDECYIYFAAQDKAGNTSKIGDNPSNKITVKLDQTAPVINSTVTLTPGNDETTITVKATDGATGSGIISTSAVLKLDGVEYKNTDGTKAGVTYTAGTTKADDSTYVFTIPNNKANLNIGTNTFTVTVTDDAKNSSTSNPVTIDYKAPELTAAVPSTLFTGSDGYAYSKNDFNITGTVTAPAGNTIKSLEWAEGTINASTAWTLITPNAAGAYTKAISSAANTSKDPTVITFRATTSFGKETNVVVKYALDKTAPVIDQANTKVGEVAANGITSSTWFNSKALVLDGKYTEAGSGIKEIKYFVKKAGDTDYSSTATGTITPIDKGNYETINKTIDNFLDGTNSIKLVVTDNVGNTKTEEITGIQVDTTAPAIKAYNATKDLTITDATTVIRVAAKDAGSGIKNSNIVIKLGDAAYTKATLGTPEAGTGDYASYTLYTYTIQNNDAGLDEGAKKITVSFTDEVGNTSTSKAVTINNDAPVISGLAIAGADSRSKTGEFVYENGTFTVGGSVSVGSYNKLKSVTWKDTYVDGDDSKELKSGISEATIADTINPNDDNGTPTYKSYEGKLVTRTYTATNVYGSTSTDVVKFVTDITKPDVQSVTVGGKTDTELTTTWLNATALKVEGSYLENGSGVGSVIITLNGTENEASVTSSTTESDTYYDFSTTIGGFVEGNSNILKFNTTDKAGNSAVEKTVTGIKVDTTAPQLAKSYKPGTNSGNQNTLWYRKTGETEWKEFTTSILTNKSKNIELRGAYSDANEDSTVAVSGVKSIKIKIGTYEINAQTVAVTPAADFGGTKEGNWQATVDFTTVDLATGSHTMSFVITDAAGNITKTNNGTILVDADNPTVKINPITDADTDTIGTQVNKTISIVGTASDKNALSKVSALQISSNYSAADPASATWAALDTENAGDSYALSGTTNWTAASFDTTKFTDGTYYIRAVAVDEAGNKGYSDVVEIKIDQNSDRPVIKIPSLESTTASIQEGTLMGTISDDDGITSFWYADADSVDDSTTWTEITVSSGSWKVEGLLSGNHQLWFKVVDKANTTFITNSTENATLTRPYLVLSSGTKADNSAEIDLAVDLDAPQITELKFAPTANTVTKFADVPGTAWVASTDTDKSVNNSPITPYLWISTKVTEAVAMNTTAANDITITIGGTAYTPTIARTQGTGTDADKYTYSIGPINLASLFTSSTTDGTKTVSVSVKDKSGRISSTTYNIYIDCHAPTVTVSYPTDSDIITGSVKVLGSVSDSTHISSVKWMIPTKASLAGKTADEIKTALLALADTNWKDTGISGNLFSSLSMDFVSAYTPATGKESLIKYATAKTGTAYTYATEKTVGEETYVTLPIYFKTADSSGNTGISKAEITLNPDGGIPTVELSSHAEEAKTSEVVNLMGTASDDEKVKAVKITKLEYSTVTKPASGTWAPAWTTLSDCSTTGLVTKGTGNADGTIDCEGTNSWKCSIDTSKIAVASGTVTAIRVTVVAYDENDTPSNKTYLIGTTPAACVRTILVDKSVPTLKSATIVGYATEPATMAAAANPVYSNPYTSGMYISTNSAAYLYLKVEVEDDSSVTGITLSGSGLAVPGTLESGKNSTNYTALLPITTADGTHIYTTMDMNDGQHTDVRTTFNFYMDNTAPTLFTKTGDAGSVRLMNDSNQELGETYLVENSNGSFVFGDKITEAGSGLQYLAFWFGRIPQGETTETRAYNPMYKKAASVDNKIDLATKAATSGTIYINDEDLACMYVTGKVESTKNQFTAAVIKTNKNIRKGGLVKYDGVYRLITAVDTTSGTVTFSPEAAAENASANAEFIFAQVVDRQGLEISDTYDTDGDSTMDGDGMVEVLKVKGAEYTWQASLDSSNIPDGPIVIHVVAIDNAGNISSGKVSTSIANNRPRVTRVLLATDLNGNGTFDFYNESSSILNDLSKDNTTVSGTQFGEFVFYSTLKPSANTSNKVGDGQSLVTLSGRTLRIKKDLLVLPEFVGGNGVLQYGYELTNTAKETDGSDKPQTSPRTGTNALVNTVAGLKLADRTGTVQKVASLIQSDKVEAADKFGGVVLTMNNTNATIAALDDGKVKNLAFTFWDATEETTQGTDSLWAMINIPAYVDVTDDTAPDGTITPFWWNSKEDSSFVYDSEGNPEGHIDLPSGSENPGVAGKVWINGTAYDETRIGAIHVIKPDTTDVTIISWNDTTKKWDCIDGAEIVSEIEPSQDGHTIKWRYQMNMTSYGVVQNKVVRTYVVDAQNNKNDTEAKTETVQTIKTALKAMYKMDFVPYIKSIYPATATSANRSRLGKFPVRAGKDMIIEGMNFGTTGFKYDVKFYKTNASIDAANEGADVQGDLVTTETISNVTTTTKGKITVTAPQNSRYVEVVVKNSETGKILGTTKNNTNKNAGYNIEAGYVASDKTTLGKTAANAAGTNFWTDDRYISVWSVAESSLFKGSINPHSGAIKKLDKYNSGSGAPTDVSGATAAAGPGGGYIYKQPFGNTEVTPETGMNDSYYAAISSDDLKLYGYVSGRDYSTAGHGDNIAFNSSEVAYVAPVDEMDYTIVNGTPYYVMQDNSLGGDSGSVWGLGLHLVREGIWYDRKYFNPYNGNTIEEGKLPFFIERQGYDKASHARDSSTGYDSVLYQFKNPRIAGWYNANDSLIYTTADLSKQNNNGVIKGVDYIYVSYYDSYAKCLKYAAFRSGHRFKTNDSKLANSVLKNWGKVDVASDIDIVAEMTSSPNRKDENNNTISSKQTAQKSYNHMTDGAAVVAGNETTSKNPTYTEVAGEWSDIFVDSTNSLDPRPVIIYYNKTKKCLEVAYGNNSFPQETSEWTKSTNIKPNGVTADFGRYVSAAMDTSGNLHVAAQDADNAKLYYLYLTKSGSTYSVANSVAVDASNGAGRWTDIELTDAAGATLSAIKPVISYIDTGFLGTTNGIKAAYLDAVSDGKLSFEAMTDPAYYSAGDQRTSVMSHVKETKSATSYADVAVGFNSDMLALDFLRGE